MRVKRALVAVAAGTVAVLVVLAYLWWRPVAVPEIDLSGAEPDVRELIEQERQRVVKSPTSARAWGELGLALVVNGYTEVGMAVLERASRLDPNEPRWPYVRAHLLLKRERSKGRDLLERVVKLAERVAPDNVECKLLLAETASEDGDTERARALLEEVLARAPLNGRAHFNLGVVCLKSDQLGQAHAHLTRAAESPYYRKRATIQLAALALRRGDRAASDRCTQSAQSMPPDLPSPDPYAPDLASLEIGRAARFRDAERLERENRPHESERILLELHEERPDARSTLALGVFRLKMGDDHGAEKLLREAIHKEPNSTSGLFALALSQFNQAEARRRAGDAAGASAKYQECERSAVAVIENKADHAPAHVILGRARLRLGRSHEAITSFRRAIACQPELATAHHSLGEALAGAGQRDEARLALEQAVALAAPHDPVGAAARQALDQLGKP